MSKSTKLLKRFIVLVLGISLFSCSESPEITPDQSDDPPFSLGRKATEEELQQAARIFSEFINYPEVRSEMRVPDLFLQLHPSFVELSRRTCQVLDQVLI